MIVLYVGNCCGGGSVRGGRNGDSVVDCSVGCDWGGDCNSLRLRWCACDKDGMLVMMVMILFVIVKVGIVIAVEVTLIVVVLFAVS